MNGQDCRDWRMGLRLTQAQLAELLRVGKGTVIEWENNALKDIPDYVEDQRRLIEVASIYEMYRNAGKALDPKDRAFPIVAETVERLISVRKMPGRARGIDATLHRYVFLDAERNEHPVVRGQIMHAAIAGTEGQDGYQASVLDKRNGAHMDISQPFATLGGAEIWLFERTPPGYSFHEAPRSLREGLYTKQ